MKVLAAQLSLNTLIRPLRRSGGQFVVLIALLVCWQLLAVAMANPLLPSVVHVAQVIAQEWASGDLLRHLGATLERVVLAFGLSMLLGIALGVFMGSHARWNRLLDPLLVILLNIPALVVIILLYIWMGLVESAAILAVVINKVPNVAVTLRQGTLSLDPQYRAVGVIYRFSAWKRFTEIVLPQLAPYLLVAARSGLALIWKIVLVVELLGRSDGVGFQLHLAFQLFDVPMLLAYSFSFIAIVQSIEWFLLQPWEQRVNRWRSCAS